MSSEDFRGRPTKRIPVEQRISRLLTGRVSPRDLEESRKRLRQLTFRMHQTSRELAKIDPELPGKASTALFMLQHERRMEKAKKKALERGIDPDPTSIARSSSRDVPFREKITAVSRANLRKQARKAMQVASESRRATRRVGHLATRMLKRSKLGKLVIGGLGLFSATRPADE